MELSEFSIGALFKCGEGRYLCTDKGSRVVVAIRVPNTVDDPIAWAGKPPYTNFSVCEVVFDKDDQRACSVVAPKQAD